KAVAQAHIALAAAVVKEGRAGHKGDLLALDGRAEQRVGIEREKIAFVPGSAFFHHGRGQRYMRLCYSFVAEDAIAPGIARLAALLAESAAPGA
ncbi:MAG: hypothetical protein AAGC55_16565, partial [Myxococcota bacterium]